MFYLRITIRAWHRRLVYATVAFSTVFGVAYFFLVIFQCGAAPRKIFQQESAGKCIPFDKVLIINTIAGVINTVADWILALLPIFILRQAQLGRAAKISAGFVLVLGSIGSICSATRLAFLRGLRPGPHFFWTAVDIAVWSVAEPGIGIIAASLATLRPLFRCCINNARSTFGSAGVTNESSRKHSDASKGAPSPIECSSRWYRFWRKPDLHFGDGGLPIANLDPRLPKHRNLREDVEHPDVIENGSITPGPVRNTDLCGSNDVRLLPPLPPPSHPLPPAPIPATHCLLQSPTPRPPSQDNEKWLTGNPTPPRSFCIQKHPTTFECLLARPNTVTQTTTDDFQPIKVEPYHCSVSPLNDWRESGSAPATGSQSTSSQASHAIERPMSDASSRYSQTPSDDYNMAPKATCLQKAERREASVLQDSEITRRKASFPHIVYQDRGWVNSRQSSQRPLHSTISQRSLYSSRIPRPIGYATTQSYTL